MNLEMVEAFMKTCEVKLKQKIPTFQQEHAHLIITANGRRDELYLTVLEEVTKFCLNEKKSKKEKYFILKESHSGQVNRVINEPHIVQTAHASNNFELRIGKEILLEKLTCLEALTCWFCFIVISNTKYFPGGEVIGLLMENSILGITDIESSKKKGRCKPGTILKLKSFIKD